MDPEHIRLERALSGAFHALDNHQRWETSDVLARAVPGSATVTDEGVQVKLKFRDTEKAMEVFRSIADGSWGGWSCLYKVYQYEQTHMAADDSEEMDEFRAISWEPLSADPVCIPADIQAGARAETFESTHGRKNVANPTANQTPGSRNSAPPVDGSPPNEAPGQHEARDQNLPNNPAPATPAAQPQERAQDGEPPATPAQPEAGGQETAAQALERSKQIYTLFSQMALPTEEASALVSNGSTLGQARARAIELDIARRDQEGTSVSITSHQPSIRMERRDDIFDACVDAMILKSRGELDEVGELAGQYKDMPALEIMRRGLRAHGSDPGDVFGAQLMQRVLSTSFFGEALASFVRRRAGAAYRGPMRNYEGLCREVETNDFRPIQIVRAQEGLRFEEVTEDDEVKYSSVAYDEGNSYQLATYRGGFKISYQVFINDDLHLLEPEFKKVTNASVRLHRRLIILPLVRNTFIVGGKTLFHADHNNIIAANQFDFDSYEEAETALFMQQGPNKAHELELAPAFLMVSKARRNAVKKELYPITPRTSQDANIASIYSNDELPELRVLTELDREEKRDSWFLFADPAEETVLERAYLSGERDPVITKQDWDDKEEYRVAFRQNVGVAAVGYRGAVRGEPEVV